MIHRVALTHTLCRAVRRSARSDEDENEIKFLEQLTLHQFAVALFAKFCKYRDTPMLKRVYRAEGRCVDASS